MTDITFRLDVEASMELIKAEPTSSTDTATCGEQEVTK